MRQDQLGAPILATSSTLLHNKHQMAVASLPRGSHAHPGQPEKAYVTPLSLLLAEQLQALPGRAQEVVEYRKSGLSLNHIQGCPLDCAYCIRHTYGLWIRGSRRRS